jgi:hypothetical protein
MGRASTVGWSTDIVVSQFEVVANRQNGANLDVVGKSVSPVPVCNTKQKAASFTLTAETLPSFTRLDGSQTRPCTP